MKSILLASLMSLTPLFAWADGYSKLWQQVEKYEDDGLPKSAYDVTQKILKKAERGGDRGQALSARLKGAALHQEWAPDSFFTDITALEALRQRETAPEARAIYASVLAWLYEHNRTRTQARDLELEADDIREWTMEQYDSAAVSNWRQSLQDMAALAKARSKDWLPFVEQNDNSAYFNHDLLYIIWNRFKAQREHIWRGTNVELASIAKQIVELYKSLGNREASLLVHLEWIQLQREANDKDLLRQCIEEYGDMPLCAEAYIALAGEYYERGEKIKIYRECIQRYHGYERIGQVRNSLNDLLKPRMTWSAERVCYPGKVYEWKIDTYNLDSLILTFYRMPDSFYEPSLSAEKDPKAWIINHGTLVQTINLNTKCNTPGESRNDTLQWTAYQPGAYAVIMTGKSSESEVKTPTTSDYDIFYCTRLQTLHQDGFGAQRTIVVDGMSGQPVEGAKVNFYYRATGDTRTTIADIITDAEGRATLDEKLLDGKSEIHIYTHVTLGDDKWLSDETSYISPKWTYAREKNTRARMYTDRSIYRPGQTVHVGGIVFTQQHWDAETVQKGTAVKLHLFDVNWKEVATAEVETDDMGKFSTSFTLPAKGLPGTYNIRCESPRETISLTVEEYKRPTFEVKMDEAPDLSWPADDITLTGKAMGYNGVPVRQARVTGTYQFTYPYWWWGRVREDSDRMPIDTVETDETGAFSIKVPLTSIPEKALTSGLYIELNVDVLSISGETRQGTTHVPICTMPLRVRLSVPDQQDRDRMTPIGVELISSTEKPTDGTVTWTLYKASEGKRISDEAVESGTLTTKDKHLTFPTEQLRDLPSGQYELFVEAVAGKDTAEAKGYFIIFGLADKRLPKVTPEWLYCPDDTFGPDQPARVQVGSSFENVAFYYSIVAADSVVEEHLIQLNDEMRVLEIPYKDFYGDGATLHTAFVKAGKTYLGQQALRLVMPERTLKWEWKTFRDHLHPGDKETWTLQITRPDGTPAPAQLMATLYDASLDALKPHYWSLFVSRGYHISSLYMDARRIFYENNSWRDLRIEMKRYKSSDMEFDKFDEEWFDGLGFRYGRREYMYLEDGAVLMAEPMMTRGVMQKASNATADFADEAAAVEEESATEAQAAEQKAGQPSTAVRTNFNETAAFLPRLMADKNGVVTLSFTLPESLTTWQLLGVAHTQDMMSATVRAQATARKEMMARLFLPRFLRGGDEASIRATVQNLTDKAMNGNAVFEVFDPETERIIVRRTATFKAGANGEALLTFPYKPDELPSVVAVRLTAKAGAFSDGEQHYLPILPGKTWITESVEIHADSIGTYTTDLTRLFNSNSPTATNRRLTVEYTANPIWHALQALPSLRTPAYDDVLSLTTSLCSEGLATYIANTTPRLKTLVNIWKQEQASGQPALDSRLQQNEELKQIILDETPWLREAETDADRKARLIDLFDENLQVVTLSEMATKLSERQSSDGGFAWFPGMKSSELMTRLVAMELTHLRTLTDNFNALPMQVQANVNAVLAKAVGFIADETAKDVKEMKKAEKKGEKVSTAYLMYLDYIYITQRAGANLNKSQKSDVRYLLDHLEGSVADMDNNERAKAAIVLKGDGRLAEAKKYYASLLEHTTTTAERGTFFDTPSGSFVPTGNKIIVHTAAMEAVRELEPDNQQLNKDLNRWLLQQKRTQMWESSICTSDAIYALLVGNGTSLEAKQPDRLTIDYSTRQVDVTREEADASISGLGYIKKQYADGEAPRSITVERHTDSEAWGAVYATYLTPITDASATSTGLDVRREFSTEQPAVGDRLTIRYVIKADRDYEYVCLSAERPACAEPASVRSGYEWRNGLGYYRAVRDTRTDYFFDSLPKGTYVLEETAFIDREGRYTTGLTTLRCLYAPEYTANTTAVTISVK